jgi:hypothetical protein
MYQSHDRLNVFSFQLQHNSLSNYSVITLILFERLNWLPWNLVCVSCQLSASQRLTPLLMVSTLQPLKFLRRNLIMLEYLKESSWKFVLRDGLCFEIPQTRRVRSQFYFPQEQRGLVTSRHLVPFSSHSTTRWTTVEVFDPASTRRYFYFLYCLFTCCWTSPAQSFLASFSSRSMAEVFSPS